MACIAGCGPALNTLPLTCRLFHTPCKTLALLRGCSNGMPVMIHMTFKDKGQFARHHMLSLASWAKENPDHAILMYDDDDLMDYIK